MQWRGMMWWAKGLLIVRRQDVLARCLLLWIKVRGQLLLRRWIDRINMFLAIHIRIRRSSHIIRSHLEHRHIVHLLWAIVLSFEEYLWAVRVNDGPNCPRSRLYIATQITLKWSIVVLQKWIIMMIVILDQVWIGWQKYCLVQSFLLANVLIRDEHFDCWPGAYFCAFVMDLVLGW